MKYLLQLLMICTLSITGTSLYAQTKGIDTSENIKAPLAPEIPNKALAKRPYDSSFSPKRATIRSAVIPGWGQVYNKQLWKVPFVYAALGITAGIFIVNVQEYTGLKNAYKLKVDTDTANDILIPDKYSVLSANSMKFYRDEYRKNVDLSVLAFLIAWALNVVDATVSGHLKQFDVSDDLSMKIKPMFTPGKQAGIGLVFNFKNKKTSFPSP